jgi:hypothetical protein
MVAPGSVSRWIVEPEPVVDDCQAGDVNSHESSGPAKARKSLRLTGTVPAVPRDAERCDDPAVDPSITTLPLRKVSGADVQTSGV